MIDLIWKACLQGIVQGITEFLPVSSTGHLILSGRFMDMGNGAFVSMFNVVIQLASILAVVICFHDKLIPKAMLQDKQIRENTFGIWFRTAVGVLPILVIGFLSRNLVEKMQSSVPVVAVSLFLGGVILLWVERRRTGQVKFDQIHCIPMKTALYIGLIQCIAMIPGVSRSGATIVGALALGCSRTAAAEYSFFLAVPTMAAASGYSLLKHGSHLAPGEWVALGAGFLVSFLVSWGVIAFLMRYIKTRTFEVFGYYRILLSAAVLVHCFFFR